MKDLNLRPSGCKPDALTAELTALYFLKSSNSRNPFPAKNRRMVRKRSETFLQQNHPILARTRRERSELRALEERFGPVRCSFFDPDFRHLAEVEGSSRQ